MSIGSAVKGLEPTTGVAARPGRYIDKASPVSPGEALRFRPNHSSELSRETSRSYFAVNLFDTELLAAKPPEPE
jgi:hypothetical protein